MIPIPEAELVDVRRLKLDGQNPNIMSEKQLARLKTSIEKFGFIVPIVTNKDLLVADGEQRLTVARHFGMKQVPVIRLPIEDVDRRLLRQVLNKLRGEHELIADALEFERIIEAGHEDELKHLLDLSDSQLEIYQQYLENPHLNIVMLNKEPASINLLPFRPITPYGSEIYRVSASTFSHKKRADAVEIVDENGNVPTLKSHSWWFHKDGREFSLREYARIQDFPDSFKFVGNYDAIKTQIGNAVSPRMAEYIASQIPKSNAISLFSGAGGMDLGFQ